MKNRKLFILIAVVGILASGCSRKNQAEIIETTMETTTKEETTREEIPATTQPESKSEELEGALVASFPVDLLPLPEGDVNVLYSSIAGERGKKGFYANATLQAFQAVEEVVEYYENQLAAAEEYDIFQEEGIWTIKGIMEGADITVNILNGSGDGKTMVALLATIKE